jgi:hypothetical protein
MMAAEALTVASRSLTIASRDEAALVALGQLIAARASEWPAEAATGTDPVAAQIEARRQRIEARRQRIEASGFRLIQGTGGRADREAG